MAVEVRRPRSLSSPPLHLSNHRKLLGGVGLLFIFATIFTFQLVPNPLPMLLLCGLCLGLIVLARPEIGVAAMLLCATIVKIEIGTGTSSPLVASLLCAVVLVSGWVVHRRLFGQPLNTLPRWLTASIALLTGFALLSWVWGHLTLDPRIAYPQNFYRVQLAQLAIVVVSVSLLFVGADLFRKRHLRSLLSGAVIGFGVLDLLMWPFIYVGASGFLNESTINTFGLFGLWFVAACWGNAVLNSKLTVPVRVMLGVLAILWLTRAIVIHGSWVSGWLPPLMAVLVVSFLAGPRVAVPVLASGAAVMAALGPYFYHVLVTTQIEEGSIGGTFGRLELWKRNLEMSQEWILLGSGPAGYALYYVTFIPHQAMSTHSNFIDILSQFGVGGLLSVLSIMLGLVVYGLRTWPRLVDPADRAFCAAAVGGIPAVMFAMWFGDWFLPFVYNQTIAGFNHSVYSWIMLAGLAGLIAQELHEEPSHA